MCFKLQIARRFVNLTASVLSKISWLCQAVRLTGSLPPDLFNRIGVAGENGECRLGHDVSIGVISSDSTPSIRANGQVWTFRPIVAGDSVLIVRGLV